jgi:oxepin-CoA hydrolase/3-oxo-5,6-dehydrosuberyl-CoA semialdehyde dehydrogenase
MAAPLDRRHLGTITARVHALQSGARAHWGKMQPADVVAHLTVALHVSLGEIVLPDESTALFRNRIVQWLLFGPLPWPKGRIESPAEFRPPPESEMDAERAVLGKAMVRFVEALEREPGRVSAHPAFGGLTLRRWSRLHGKHFDHHLKQFGV